MPKVKPFMGLPTKRRLNPCENLQQSLDKLDRMEVEADAAVYDHLLRACAQTSDLSSGERLHEHIVRSGHDNDQYLGSLVLNMYIKCKALGKAEELFEEMARPNVHSWSFMIGAYACLEDGNRSWQLFDKMQCEGTIPRKVTFAYALAACSYSAAFAKAKQLHAMIVHNGFGTCCKVATALVSTYAKCGCLPAARSVFDRMVERDLVCWNAMMAAYGQYGVEEEALRMFYEMQQDETTPIPNRSTFASVLDACAGIASIVDGMYIHHYVICCGLDSDIVVATAVANMHGKCGSFLDSLDMFDRTEEKDVIFWNTMVAASIQHGFYDAAFQLTVQMRIEGCSIDQATIVGVLSACANRADIKAGQQFHLQSILLNLELGIEVGSAIINMYGKCGAVKEAERVFDRLQRRDILAWTAMITVYAQNEEYKLGLHLFEQMQKERAVPDRVAFLSILPAYAGQAAITEAYHMHATVCYIGLETDTEITNALITMYGKCGSLESAHKVFEKMPSPDVVSWNAIIAAYAEHGFGKKVFWLYDQMGKVGVKPDCITYVSIFLACSHSGLLEEGRQCLASMTREQNVELAPQHLNCLIDLLARAGHLDEAENLLKTLECQPTYAQWVSLLGACRSQSDVERGERAAVQAFCLDPSNKSPYLMLSNLYARTKDNESKMMSNT